MLHASSFADPDLGGSGQEIRVVHKWEVLHICIVLLVLHPLLLHFVFKHIILVAKVIDQTLSETWKDFKRRLDWQSVSWWVDISGSAVWTTLNLTQKSGFTNPLASGTVYDKVWYGWKILHIRFYTFWSNVDETCWRVGCKETEKADRLRTSRVAPASGSWHGLSHWAGPDNYNWIYELSHWAGPDSNIRFSTIGHHVWLIGYAHLCSFMLIYTQVHNKVIIIYELCCGPPLCNIKTRFHFFTEINN